MKETIAIGVVIKCRKQFNELLWYCLNLIACSENDEFIFMNFFSLLLLLLLLSPYDLANEEVTTEAKKNIPFFLNI